MNIAYMEGCFTADNLEHHLMEVCDAADVLGADALLLPEMPVDPWLAQKEKFSAEQARASIKAHERLINILAETGKSFYFTRPVEEGGRLVNEACFLQSNDLHTLHSKQIFPNESGWHESQWFRPGGTRFGVHQLHGVRLAFAICTEMMWPNYARHYLRKEVDVILAPRATERPCEKWTLAGRMLSLVSGCYVISSNRTGSTNFGGEGFCVLPDIKLESLTSTHEPMRMVRVDTASVVAARRQYPVYIPEPELTFSSDMKAE